MCVARVRFFPLENTPSPIHAVASPHTRAWLKPNCYKRERYSAGTGVVLASFFFRTVTRYASAAARVITLRRTSVYGRRTSRTAADAIVKILNYSRPRVSQNMRYYCCCVVVSYLHVTFRLSPAATCLATSDSADAVFSEPYRQKWESSPIGQTDRFAARERLKIRKLRGQPFVFVDTTLLHYGVVCNKTQ